MEDIHVNEMNSHRCLNRSLRDAAWSQFFSFLSYKAESAGREFKKINPAYTTQDCSSCGHRQKIPLWRISPKLTPPEIRSGGFFNGGHWGVEIVKSATFSSRREDGQGVY